MSEESNVGGVVLLRSAIMEIVTETLKAAARGERSGVKIARTSTGMNVELHLYEGADEATVTDLARIARAEYDKQYGMVSIPQDELTELQLLASIGKLCQEQHPPYDSSPTLTAGRV